MNPPYLTIKQAAEALNVSAARVRRLVADGRFPGAHRVGARLIVIPAEDVDAFRRKTGGWPKGVPRRGRSVWTERKPTG